MRLLEWAKDGGKDSHVDGFFLIEVKSLFSVVLLKFGSGSREAYHSHAFPALSWVLKGYMNEHSLDGTIRRFEPSLKPKWTPRKKFHRVLSDGNTWVLTFRGPWVNKWREFIPATNKFITLTHGRKVVSV